MCLNTVNLMLLYISCFLFFFFFQAEDGIRDSSVTGVQTCALPIWGYDAQWRDGLSPWQVHVAGDHWYGRGTADNKGQHSINLAALKAVLDARSGRLGFNLKLLYETGEEVGSPGLHAVCEALRDELSADVLIASDGPRLGAAHPTVFLGSRGVVNFKLDLNLPQAAHHSPNCDALLP